MTVRQEFYIADLLLIMHAAAFPPINTTERLFHLHQPGYLRLPRSSSYLSVVRPGSRCPFSLVHATTETHLLSKGFGS